MLVIDMKVNSSSHDHMIWQQSHLAYVLGTSSRCIPLIPDSTSHAIAPHIQASRSRSVTGRLPILLRLLSSNLEPLLLRTGSQFHAIRQNADFRRYRAIAPFDQSIERLW
jgi:hypothetical protein